MKQQEQRITHKYFISDHEIQWGDKVYLIYPNREEHYGHEDDMRTVY